MTINSYQATAILKDELAASEEHDFWEEGMFLMWHYGGRDYMVSLVLFDATKVEV